MDPAAHIHSVELSVADLDRSRGFYEGMLGLEVLRDDPLELGAGGKTLLRLTRVPGGEPAPPDSTGLYHVAFLHPSRVELARALRRLAELGGRLDGASDHGVSEALYLHDPDWHGIELYWDRPVDQWPLEPDGSVAMMTIPLDVQSLVAEAEDGGGGVHPDTDVGHVHLRVSDIERSIVFYRDELGLNLRQRFGEQAAFLAAGDYHHHVGINTWQSRGGSPPPAGSAALQRFSFALPDANGEQDAVDPDGIAIGFVAAQ